MTQLTNNLSSARKEIDQLDKQRNDEIDSSLDYMVLWKELVHQKEVEQPLIAVGDSTKARRGRKDAGDLWPYSREGGSSYTIERD